MVLVGYSLGLVSALGVLFLMTGLYFVPGMASRLTGLELDPANILWYHYLSFGPWLCFALIMFSRVLSLIRTGRNGVETHRDQQDH